MHKVAVVFGTRPEAIKLAPVVQALRSAPDLQPCVVVTAQHREMLDQVLELFEITPNHDLDILQPGQTLTQVTTRALAGLSDVLAAERPDAVVVQGDTTTSFVGGLAGFYAQLPVVHVEAGLRSGNRRSPYPEEVNRRLATQLSDLHLAPTRSSRRNLEAEGVAPESIVVTGNTVIDALHWGVRKARDLPFTEPVLEKVMSDERRVLLVTAHRRESWGQGMRSIAAALATLCHSHPDLLVVFPMHRNPLVREPMTAALGATENALLLDPLDYADFARAMERAHLLLTDSGGVQEEGPSLGKPVLVMRDTTERPEAVEAGTVELVGTDADVIVDRVSTLLADTAAYDAMANAVNPYGDGDAARRTVTSIAHHLGLGPPSDEFG